MPPSLLARHALMAALVTLVACGSARAQWTVSGAVRAPRYTGGAVEPTTGRSLRPYRPTMWELGLSWDGRRHGTGVRLRYASSSLALEGADGLAAVKHALSVYGFDPEVSARIAAVGTGNVLRLFAGPVIELWKLPELEARWRLGAAGGIGLDVGFGGRWSGQVRLLGGVTGSPFAQSELDAGLRRRALWRREASAGLRYRL